MIMINKGIAAIAGFTNIVIMRIRIKIMRILIMIRLSVYMIMLIIIMTMTGIAAIAGSAMIAATMAESLDAPFLQVIKSSYLLS